MAYQVALNGSASVRERRGKINLDMMGVRECACSLACVYVSTGGAGQSKHGAHLQSLARDNRQVDRSRDIRNCARARVCVCVFAGWLICEGLYVCRVVLVDSVSLGWCVGEFRSRLRVTTHTKLNSVLDMQGWLVSQSVESQLARLLSFQKRSE